MFTNAVDIFVMHGAHTLYFWHLHLHHAYFWNYVVHIGDSILICKVLDIRGPSDMVGCHMAISHVLYLKHILTMGVVQPHVQVATWLATTISLIFHNMCNKRQHWVSASRPLKDALCVNSTWHLVFGGVISKHIDFLCHGNLPPSSMSKDRSMCHLFFLVIV